MSPSYAEACCSGTGFSNSDRSGCCRRRSVQFYPQFVAFRKARGLPAGKHAGDGRAGYRLCAGGVATQQLRLACLDIDDGDFCAVCGEEVDQRRTRRCGDVGGVPDERRARSQKAPRFGLGSGDHGPLIARGRNPQIAALRVQRDDGGIGRRVRLDPMVLAGSGQGHLPRNAQSSPQVPDGTMSLEMLDGFFTALVIGPELVMPSEYLPWIWGDDDEEPDWDSPEQAEYVFDLLTKHWNAIAERRLQNAEHRPIIDTFGVAMPGEEWADGFVAGMEMPGDAWDPMVDDRQASEIILPILALCGDIPEEVQEKLTDETRAAILEHLPVMVQMIAAYWREWDEGFSGGEPIRSAKVGRNEPCPCGSGKKFKKCCGSGTPPTVH